jgi:GNAT superfamily N-acetyltransferase
VAVRIAELRPTDVELVDRHLPLNRLREPLDEHRTYLIAWEEDQPLGHAHIAWSDTELSLPEIQDVFVLPQHRRRGIATALTRAAEREARSRGHDRITLSVSLDGNEPARRLYEALGYVPADHAPVRVVGEIMVRGRPFAVDDTLVYLTKALGPDA